MKITNQKLLINLFEKEFPLKNQEKWDFSGFSFISPIEKKLKIMISLDVDKTSILRAIKEDVSLIVSHHPFCFASSKQEAIKNDASKTELFKLLLNNNISTYSLHTNFDSHIRGTSYFLLKRLELSNNIVKNYKFGSVVEYFSSFESLIKLLKNKFSLSFVLSNWSVNLDSKIKKIYFAPGAGDIYEYIEKYKKDKCDLLVTSDIKWNEQVVLQNLGLKFIIISHKVEEVFIDGVSDFLKNKLSNNIEIILDYRNDELKNY